MENKKVKSKIYHYNFFPKNRKGQVTIFIIIAVLIVAAVGVYFGLKNSLSIEKKVSVEIQPIQTNILSCLEKTTKEGLEYISLHGGYYNVPEKLSIMYYDEDIPYYYVNSNAIVPSIGRVEKELESYIFENLEFCLDFEYFEKQGFEISKGNLLISIKIEEKIVKNNAEYPLTIRKDSTTRLKNFAIEIDSSVKKLLESSEEIVEKYIEKPGFMCLTCLEEISERRNVEISVTPFQDLTIFGNKIFWFSISEKDDLSIDKLNWMFVVEQ